MNITITLQDGKKLSAEMTDFNSAAFAEMLNENPHQMFAFGDAGVLKHLVKLYEPTPLEETPPV